MCRRCGVPFASPVALEADLPVCADCRGEDFEFDAARAYGIYRGNLRTAILRTKFQRRERLGLRLAGLLVSNWDWVKENLDSDSPLLVPVPLHASRQKERGFNQAELLAAGLRRELEKWRERQPIRLETRAVRRTRATIPQTGLSLRQRHENVRGVFSVVAADRLSGRQVVLIDDVMTTGATVSACAGTLKRGGARKVLVLTLARATPQFPDDTSAADREPVDDSGRVQR